MKRKMKKEKMNFIEWLKKNQDKDSMFAPPMDSQTAIEFLCEYLLGSSFFVPYPASREQRNTEIVCEILEFYSERFIKEIRKEGE